MPANVIGIKNSTREAREEAYLEECVMITHNTRGGEGKCDYKT